MTSLGRSVSPTMKRQPVHRGWLSSDVVTEIVDRLDRGERINRALPDEGRIHIDRPLPFLCVYRRPLTGYDAGTARLVESEASFLVAPASTQAKGAVSSLVSHVARRMATRFGAFLIIEVWSTADTEVAAAAAHDDVEPTEQRPSFVVAAAGRNTSLATAEALRRQLSRIRVLRQSADVRIDTTVSTHPPDVPRLLSMSAARELRCTTIGLRVRPIYRNHSTGELYPQVLRSLKRGLGRALKQACFHFARNKTSATPEHYYALGRRALVKAVWDVDQRLSELGDSFDFLLQITPVNAEAAWREFRRSRFESMPRFYYRPLAVEPARLKRRLFEVPIERIEDPTLSYLFRQRQDELDRKLTMLSDVGTSRFLLGSLQVYDRPSPRLLDLARQLLDAISPGRRERSRGGQIGASEFAERAREEIAHYRRRLPEFSATAVVRDDIYSGLMCSGGRLLIGQQTKFPSQRVDALLQHEVGTHLVTYYNGLLEPLQHLHTGFAGYDALQEGLAVLAEYLVGGLSGARVRLLAGRVVAADLLVRGSTFVETFHVLHRQYRFAQRTAYTMTMRTYRAGGIAKDAVYLDGLVQILEYLGAGGELDPLFVGKIATEHIPLVRELQLRKVLHPAALLPRFLQMPGAAERLRSLRHGSSVLELLGSHNQ